MSKRNTVVTAIVVSLLALFATFPLAQGPVWDGSFPLAVTLDYDAAAVSEQVRFALCFDDSQKSELDLTDASKVELDYLNGKIVALQTHVLTIPCSGRGGYFGIGSSRYQPSYLVIEYEAIGHPRRWKIVPIPTNPAHRAIKVTLP